MRKIALLASALALIATPALAHGGGYGGGGFHGGGGGFHGGGGYHGGGGWHGGGGHWHGGYGGRGYGWGGPGIFIGGGYPYGGYGYDGGYDGYYQQPEVYAQPAPPQVIYQQGPTVVQTRTEVEDHYIVENHTHYVSRHRPVRHRVVHKKPCGCK